MTCAWKELLAVLPAWVRKEVDSVGPETLQELRLRINSPPELVLSEKSVFLNHTISAEDLNYTVNAASRYSPWAAASAAKGFITIAGGHRIGLCGEAVVQQGEVRTIKRITSLCIRVAKDFPGIAAMAANVNGSIIILGAPGWGKTTLLRDLIRQIEHKEKICILDERKELFPEELLSDCRVDVLSGCSKQDGIPMLLRTMGPSCIAVDEITDTKDAASFLQAANCGVRLLATAHAVSLSDFCHREAYRPIVENNVFDAFLILKKDKTFTVERIREWNTSGSVRY